MPISKLTLVHEKVNLKDAKRWLEKHISQNELDTKANATK